MSVVEEILSDPDWFAEVGTILTVRKQKYHPALFREAPFAIVTEHRKGRKTFKVKFLRADFTKVKETIWNGKDTSEFDAWVMRPVTDDDLKADNIKKPLLPGEFECKYSRALGKDAWEVHTEKDGKKYMRFFLTFYNPEKCYYYQ